MSAALRVLVAGGGMITADLILPSLYHLQRLERIGQISICARGSASLRALSEDPRIREAFPGGTFSAHPPFRLRRNSGRRTRSRRRSAACRPGRSSWLPCPTSRTTTWS